MRFMILVKGTKESEAGDRPPDELFTAMADYHEKLAKAGVLLDGSGLQSSSKGWRIRYSGDKRTVVDGPFAETKELVAGYTMIQASIAMLPNVDVVVAGEVQEWESATYAQDVAFAGLKKGFISIGRVVNEGPGMQVCAEWLKPIVPEVPIRFIPAGDPYWRPL